MPSYICIDFAQFFKLLVTDALLQTTQQELDEMKLKNNLLCEENADLKSQLDTMHKQLKENRKLVEKYMEIEFKKEHDAATQTDLVCVI